jgi:hypothetical protein
MGSFKVVKQEEQAPEYSDYIKRRIDLAANEGTVYEFDDEDRRIDALHKNSNLYSEKRLLTMDRVNVRNKEYLVLGVEVSFFNVNTQTRADRYIDYIGKTLKPEKTVDPRTNQLAVTPVYVLHYDIEFAPEKVDQFITQFNAPDEFRFYTATTNPNTDIKPVEVKRKEFFRNATWDELLMGKEKEYTSSTQNKLSKLRREVDYEERQQFTSSSTAANDDDDDDAAPTEIKTFNNKPLVTSSPQPTSKKETTNIDRTISNTSNEEILPKPSNDVIVSKNEVTSTSSASTSANKKGNNTNNSGNSK